MKKHSTKKALIASLLMLCLCFTSLIGTTYAWFTDSVASGSNVIKAGNLDLEVEYTVDGGENWKNLAGATDLFQKGLWEPGHTEIIALRVKNTGTLALKYTAQMNIFEEFAGTNKAGETFLLSKFLEVSTMTMGGASEEDNLYADIFTEYYLSSEAASADWATTTFDSTNILGNSDQIILPGYHACVLVKVNMPETVGNEANAKSPADAPSIEFGINVLATQVPSEKDSFGNDYDKAATYYGTTVAPAPAVGESAIEVPVLNDQQKKVGNMTIPTAALADPTKETVVNITPTTYKPNITVEAGMETMTFNVDVDNLKEGNTTPIKVQLFVGMGMNPATFTVYHYNQMIQAPYNPNDGYVTFETTNFSPFTIKYDAESVYVPPVVDENEPAAAVSAMPQYVGVTLPWGSYGQWSPDKSVDADPKLEAAYQFTATQTLEQAMASDYANWECDFFVKLDRDLGKNQIFLGGNYGSFGWVGFHNGDVTVKANEEIPLLGSVTSTAWTYTDVVQFVGTFLCGVGDVNNALSGATFTVTLRLTNPETGATVDVAVITHKFA